MLANFCADSLVVAVAPTTTGESGSRAPAGVAPAWIELGSPGLHACALRIDREDVAFFKHLIESFEDVALVRTAEGRGDQVVLAVIAPSDYLGDAGEILLEVARREPGRFTWTNLPTRCVEDWFLAEWSSVDTGRA